MENLDFAKNRDTPFIVSGGKKAHLNARGHVYEGREDRNVFLLFPPFPPLLP